MSVDDSHYQAFDGKARDEDTSNNDLNFSHDQSPAPVHLPDEKASFSARMGFAMMYARMTTPMLRKRMKEDYGITISKSGMSKILNGQTRRTRYFLEMADIMGVNPRWLATGKETMIDSTGRLSSRDQAAKDVKRLMKQYLVPPQRSDLVRLHDKLVDIMTANRLSREHVDLLENILSTVITNHDGKPTRPLRSPLGSDDTA